MDALQQAFKTGKIPYRYEFDIWSGVYFGFVILIITFVFTLSSAIIRRAIG
jgi:hypothetical protein